MTDHHDRDTVVVDRDSGSGMATILSVIVIVALLIAVWYFTLGPGTGQTGETDRDAGGENPAVPSLEVPGGGGGSPAP